MDNHTRNERKIQDICLDRKESAFYTCISSQRTRVLNMTDRQSQFLKQIIDSYISTAEPVASGFLAQKSNVSSATIRNDMAVLEDQGFIEQPHTSAGRIPTVKGYRYYLQNHFSSKQPNAAQKKKLDQIKSDRMAKDLAKAVADLSNLAVLVAFAENDFFYTGISYLFSQPEFHQPEAVINISSVLDALDETLEELYETANDSTKILVGDENPFSPKCSLLLQKSKVQQGGTGVMAILGPVRMDYRQNAGLLDYSANLLNTSLK
jgi:transcriptional regulator of heat shock response